MGPDRVLAKIDNTTNTSYYYLYNGHGDVVQIIDTSGTVKNNYDYDVWGNFLKKEETIDNHFTYFGQTYDETTGLYYLRGRYYDPTTGRFTQQDSAEDGYNWYVYGNNNPVMYVDPSGAMAAIVQQLANTPVGQQILNQLSSYATQSGVTLTTYISNNLPQVQQLIDSAGNVIPAVWDWTTNTAMPWVAEKAQKIGQSISDGIQYVSDKVDQGVNNAKEWFNNQFNDNKPSLKNINNNAANKIAQKNGFNDAHDFKEYFVGKNNISKFNIKIDKNTGQLFLESVKKGGELIATGYYK